MSGLGETFLLVQSGVSYMSTFVGNRVSDFKLIYESSEGLNIFCRLSAASMEVANKSRFKTAITAFRGFASLAESYEIIPAINEFPFKKFNWKNYNHLQKIAFAMANLNDTVSWFEDKKVINLRGYGPLLETLGSFGAATGLVRELWKGVKELTESPIEVEPSTEMTAKKQCVFLKVASNFLEFTLITTPYYAKMNKNARAVMTVISKAAALGAFLIEKKYKI